MGAMRKAVFLFLLISLSWVCSAFAFDLEGKVRLEPPLPEPAWLEIPQEHVKECGSKKRSPKLQISPEGFVANAVVKLEGILPAQRGQSPLEETVPSPAYVFDQINCEFAPHVLLLPQGAALSILNSEAMLHNVRAFNEDTEMLFNDAMPKKGQVLKKRFNEPGRIILRCGIHHWMHAIAVVQEHPFYAITDSNGHFKIEGIPEGTYTLSVWHETLGELKTEVNPAAHEAILTYPRQTNEPLYQAVR